MITTLAWLGCTGPVADDALIVSVRAFGTNEALEQQIAGPLEAELSTLPRTTGLRTTIDGDLVVVEVSLRSGSALADLAGALDDVRRVLPEEARIEVQARGGGETTVYLQLSGGSPQDHAATWERLRPELQRLPGVRAVEACGAGAPQIVVRVDPAAAAARTISLAEIETAAATASSVEAMADAVVRDGVRLGDVANVELGIAPSECRAYAGSASVWIGEVRAAGPIDLGPAFAGLDGPIQVVRLADAPVVQFRRPPDAEGAGPAVAAAVPRAVVLDRRSGVGRVVGGDAAAIRAVPGVTGAWDPATAQIVRVIGPELDELARVRDALVARLVEATPADAPPRASVEVTVDRERAAALGIAPDVVARALAAAWQGLPVGGGGIPVVVRVGADGTALEAATFPGPNGVVPVSAVATLLRGTDRAILRVDCQRAVELVVTGEAALARLIAEVPLAPGYRIEIVPRVR